jgi:hypothetical protein
MRHEIATLMPERLRKSSCASLIRSWSNAFPTSRNSCRLTSGTKDSKTRRGKGEGWSPCPSRKWTRSRGNGQVLLQTNGTNKLVINGSGLSVTDSLGKERPRLPDSGLPGRSSFPHEIVHHACRACTPSELVLVYFAHRMGFV